MVHHRTIIVTILWWRSHGACAWRQRSTTPASAARAERGRRFPTTARPEPTLHRVQRLAQQVCRRPSVPHAGRAHARRTWVAVTVAASTTACHDVPACRWGGPPPSLPVPGREHVHAPQAERREQQQARARPGRPPRHRDTFVEPSFGRAASQAGRGVYNRVGAGACRPPAPQQDGLTHVSKAAKPITRIAPTAVGSDTGTLERARGATAGSATITFPPRPTRGASRRGRQRCRGSRTFTAAGSRHSVASAPPSAAGRGVARRRRGRSITFPSTIRTSARTLLPAYGRRLGVGQAARLRTSGHHLVERVARLDAVAGATTVVQDR